MNLANSLTLVRIILLPFFLVFLLIPSVQNFDLALALFIIASITDTLDGYVARNFNQMTKLGSIIDPLADKILTIGAFVSLTYLKLISPWLVIIIIAREFIISAFRIIAASEGRVISASWYGKFKTIFQMSLIISILLTQRFSALDTYYVNTALTVITLVLTVVSLYDYIVKNKEVLKENK